MGSGGSGVRNKEMKFSGLFIGNWVGNPEFLFNEQDFIEYFEKFTSWKKLPTVNLLEKSERP